MEADLSNWRESPHNVWAFHNIDKVLSTHPVKTGDATASIPSNDTRSFDGFQIQLSASPELDLAGFQAVTKTDGMVVLHKGKIVHEFYDHGNERTSKHILMSMTKSVTGLVTGILASQGKFDVNKPIKHYVPEASSVFDSVTVQQCLDMNSGIKYNDGNHEYRAAAGWNPLRGDEAHKTLHDFLSHVEAATDGPGAGFNYASLNTDLLGWALERATGKKLAELISELLWQPMGAESDALVAVDSEGSARAAGGFCATVRDIARIGQLVADGGRDIVPSSWIEDMMHHGDKDAFANGAWAPGFVGDLDSVAYRDCWLADSDTNVLCGLGIHGQMLVVDRTNNIVLAKTSSQATAVDFGSVKMVVRAFKEFQRILVD
ncbi:hypothetical protein LTR36_002637 [Oleoguttula mirabilis]|uniref:Beta-lactamase-related domain-containing protein n=1 Tax=Oleoguttula mirabilis TaxID=1507867 RepID=A0AAV9JJR8_9PEZI|nr:hypothetical protein LTR36_002637 [Oleoguttula mirabilis]